jgi:hypothetical protein
VVTRVESESRLVQTSIKLGVWGGGIILTGDFIVVYRDRVPFGFPDGLFAAVSNINLIFSSHGKLGFMPEQVCARSNILE